MNSWNEDSNIANDMVRVVKFNFMTNDGPGSMTAMVNKGITIASAKEELLASVVNMYTTVEITDYEILEIVTDAPIH